MMMQTQAAPRVGKVAGIFDHVQMMHPHEGQSHPHTMHNFIQVTGMLLELSDGVLLDLLRPKDPAAGAAALLAQAPLDLPQPRLNLRAFSLRPRLARTEFRRDLTHPLRRSTSQ